MAPNNAVAGTKRKRTTERKFYAVKEGKKPGIYNTWDDCLNQVRGHRGASFKAFPTLAEAQAFIEGKAAPQNGSAQPGEQKFYAVQNGRKPGVYTDWPSAQAQIRGYSHPRHKKFNSRAEAEEFVAAGKTNFAESKTALTPDEEIRRLIVQNSAPGLQLNGTYQPFDKNGDPYPVGLGPLPPGAEDGFDPNIRLDPSGTLVNKSEEEKSKTKLIPKESSPPGMLRIYTDGSSLANGTPGARAGVGVFFGPQDPKYDSSSPPPSPRMLQTQTVYPIDWETRKQWLKDNRPTNDDDEPREPKLTNWRYRNVSEALKGSKQTNQRAELTAIQRALDIAPRYRDVTIYTDSKYAIDCVTDWYRNWVRNGWVNSKGKPVENKDLVVHVRDNIEERELLGKKTFFVWVKGHSTTQGNVEADKLAVAGARMEPNDDDNNDEDGDETVTDSADKSDGPNGVKIPVARSEESEDVKLAYEDMAKAMEEDDDNNNDGPNGYA